MSRRTRPKDPFRDQRRRAANEELRERVHTRFVAMYRLLRRKHAAPQIKGGAPADVTGASITNSRAREMAVDYAVANRETRRREYGERSEREGPPTMAIPQGRRKKRRS